MPTKAQIKALYTASIRNKTAVGSIAVSDVADAFDLLLNYPETATPANTLLTFDSHEQFTRLNQSGPLSFTLATSGHLDNASYTWAITTDGTSDITFDASKFDVRGSIDKAQHNILQFVNPTADLSIRTLVIITTVPKYGAAVVVSPPTSITATQTSTGLIKVDFVLGANATSAVVERATNQAFTNGLTQVYAGTANSTTDTTVGASVNYWYRVRGQRSGSADSANLVTTQSTSSGANPHIDTPQYYHWGGPNQTPQNQNLTPASVQDFDFSNSPFSIGFFLRLPTQGVSRLTMGRYTGSQRCIDLLVKNEAADGQAGGEGSTIALGLFDQTSTSSSPQYAYKESKNSDLLAQGNFVRFIATSDAQGGIQFFQNGVLMKKPDGSALDLYTGSNGFHNTHTGGTFSIGANPALSDHNQTQLADIDVLFFANRVLTQAEATEDWNNGVRNSMDGVSFINAIFAAYYFNGSLQDSIGAHSFTANSPIFVNS